MTPGYSPPHPCSFFPFHKNESNAISNWLSLPRISFTMVLKLATSMAPNKAVQAKREGTKDGGLARMGRSFISGHVSNPCPRQWLVKHPMR